MSSTQHRPSDTDIETRAERRPGETPGREGRLPTDRRGASDVEVRVPVEVELLRQRLQDAEDMLRAIRLGEVDALVVQGPEGPRTYTLVTADQAYRLLVEQMREGALTLTSDGLVVYTNPRFADMLGEDRKRVPGQYLETFVPAEQRALLGQLIRQASQGSAGATLDLCRDDGSVTPVHVSLSVLRSGAFTGFCGVVTDLTAQMRREREAADERLTQAILEHAGQAILVCDTLGIVLRANRIGIDLCGADSVGQSLDVVCSSAGLFARVTAAHERCELTIRSGDSSTEVLVGARPIDTLDVGARGATTWVVTLVDITERKAAETRRASMLEIERTLRAEAEQANRAKSEFLATMSHELRTPLNAIGGHVELIELGIHGDVTPEQLNALGRVRQSQRQLLALINNVLNFARLEAGRLEYANHEFDLVEILYEIEPLFAPQLSAAGLSSTTIEPTEPVRIRGDRDKVSQIVRNLVSNAVKFTPRGGRVTLSVSVDLDSRRGCLQVEDSGQGIPSDKLDTIFEPFVQISRSHPHSSGGVGLGLSISRTLARAMNGDLTVESRVGIGSIFTVKLPLAASEERGNG